MIAFILLIALISGGLVIYFRSRKKKDEPLTGPTDTQKQRIKDYSFESRNSPYRTGQSTRRHDYYPETKSGDDFSTGFVMGSLMNDHSSHNDHSHDSGSSWGGGDSGGGGSSSDWGSSDSGSSDSSSSSSFGD